jgi:hypothetical protein
MVPGIIFMKMAQRKVNANTFLVMGNMLATTRTEL